MIFLISVLIFLSLALAGFAISGWARQREEAKDALGRRLTTMTGTPVVGSTASVLKDRRLSRIGVLNSLLERIAVTSWFVKIVQQAGLKRRVGEIVLYIPLLASLAFLVVTLLTGRILFASIAALWAGLLPLFFLLRLRNKRRAQFTEQLPDALDLIRAALQAGHGFLSALQVVAQEFPDPIAGELNEVAEEVRLGMPLRDALKHLMERIEDPNLPILSLGVMITQELGGNLAEVLDNISYTIRERFKLLREVRVMTAQGRLSGMVLTALPFIVATLLIMFNPEYFRPMIENRTGHFMILYALVSIALGHIVIQRIVRIEV
jgi:tight adherence protein B